MKNVAHNGFGCPCCRSAMAEEPEQSDDETSTLLDDDEDEDDDDEISILRAEEDDNALRGLRFFTSRIEGDAPNQEDIVTEYQYLQDQEKNPVPSLDYMVQKFEENGITFRQLVASFLICHEEFENDDTLERIEGDIWGTSRIIISNYVPEEVPLVVAEEKPVPAEEVVVIEVQDFPLNVTQRSAEKVNDWNPFMTDELCDLVIGPDIFEMPLREMYPVEVDNGWTFLDERDVDIFEMDEIDKQILQLVIA